MSALEDEEEYGALVEEEGDSEVDGFDADVAETVTIDNEYFLPEFQTIIEKTCTLSIQDETDDDQWDQVAEKPNQNLQLKIEFAPFPKKVRS